MKNFSPEELFRFLEKDDVLLIDLRSAEEFAQQLLPGSISIPFVSNKAVSELGAILGNYAECLLLAGPSTDSNELVTFAENCGLKNIAGTYIGSFEKLSPKKIDLVITIDADELAMDLPHDDAIVLVDVRSIEEFEEGHLTDASHLPLLEMGDPANIALLPEESNIYIYCSDGNRSMTAASLLKHHGIHNLRVVMSSWDQIREMENLKISKDASRLN